MGNKTKSIKELEDEVGKANLEKGLAWLMKVKKATLKNCTVSFENRYFAKVSIECFYEK